VFTFVTLHIRNRSAIHATVINVSRRSRATIFTFSTSPFASFSSENGSKMD